MTQHYAFYEQPVKRPRTELEQELFEALMEMSSLFENYPETLEMIGTYQVMNKALMKTINTTTYTP